jgi:hypothetical protein
MSKLLVRVALLLGAVGLLAGLGIGLSLRRGYVDAFYARFAAPPAGSLVLGTSRAAQGIKPSVLATRLGGRYQGPWLNYAFTLAESPYGPGYLGSIRRKLALGTRHGLFVVAVDPWSLALPKAALDKRPLILPEANSMVSRLRDVSQSPNLDYLAHYLHKPFYQLLLDTNPARVIERLHPDGWLEIALPPPSADTALLRRRTAEKLATYRPLAANSRLAAARLLSLWEDFQPDFDQLMRQLGERQGVPYLTYLGQPYPTNDGNHLHRDAVEAFSQRLATAIAQLPAQP